MSPGQLVRLDRPTVLSPPVGGLPSSVKMWTVRSVGVALDLGDQLQLVRFWLLGPHSDVVRAGNRTRLGSVVVSERQWNSRQR